MPHIKTRGLVLREVNYKDSDKILTVLTQDYGKLTVKARQCRRRGSRIAASAQLLVYSDMTLFEYKDYYTLNEAESVEQFWGIKADVEKLALCSYFAEVAERVAKNGESENALLSLVLNTIYALATLDKPPALVKAAFELKCACLAGYEPFLSGCARCGKVDPDGALLDLSAGHLLCATCREAGLGIALPLSQNALAAMRYVAYGDPRRLFSFALDRNGLQQMSDACEAFLITQLERGFHTLDFYKSLMALNLPSS
ncbi:MAG: recombination and repair protein RecO [Oscillospiraceae bacterium]|nr:recombination and repair protein RecO [Oscillospiraceae bacterium]